MNSKKDLYRKLSLAFLFIIFLILFIGILSLYSVKKININNEFKGKANELIKELDFLTTKSLLLNNTDNLEDYEQIK